MSTSPPRSHTKLAIAIVAAALIIGSIVYLTSSPTSATRTLTFTLTTASVASVTTTLTTTVTASCDSSSTLHCVVFQQLGACNPEFWGVPWSVTIGGTTKVQPPGTPPPGPDSGLAGTSNKNLTVIAFSLADGIYNFSVRPSNFYFTPDSGTLDVNGTDVLVQIAYTGTSCTAVQTSSATTADVIVESAINASSACSPSEAWESSSAMNNLRSSIMSQPEFIALAQNRSYFDAGYGCSLVNGTEFTVDFEYTDMAHPFHVCGNSTAYPTYEIEARIYLLPTGYDLSKTTYSTRYYDSQNMTVDCTTTTTTTTTTT